MRIIKLLYKMGNNNRDEQKQKGWMCICKIQLVQHDVQK
jgi:hypothetical protein